MNSLQASDLTVGGLAATAVTVVNDNSVSFDLPPGLAEGVYEVAIAAGAILDVQGTPIEPFASTLRVDTTPPRVVKSSLL